MLAQPQLLARSGASATFLAGGELPYVSTDANGRNATVFKPYGVSLKITPRIDRNDVIRSLIEVEASSVDTSLNLPGGPALRMRRASTEFNVRSGSTLVIGGFLSREQGRDVSGLPGLLDVPAGGFVCVASLSVARNRAGDLRDAAHRVRAGSRPGRAGATRPGPARRGVSRPRVWAPRPWPPTLARRRVGPYRGPGSQWSDAAAVRAPHNQE